MPTTQVENDVRLSRKKPKGVGAWKLPTPEAHGSGCSPDARGNRTEVEAELGGEHFTKAGVVISDRGWLEVHRGGNCDLPKWRPTVVFALRRAPGKLQTTGFEELNFGSLYMTDRCPCCPWSLAWAGGPSCSIFFAFDASAPTGCPLRSRFCYRSLFGLVWNPASCLTSEVPVLQLGGGL